MQQGDHLYVNRGSYLHHGIAVGNDTVIEYGADEREHWGSGLWALMTVRQVPIEKFARGGTVQVWPYGTRLSAEETVTRARSRLGETGYHLIANNCEHFARWCAAGEHASIQVEVATSTVGVAALVGFAPRVGLNVVTSVGKAAVLIAPNLMSGLAAVGGSAMGGIVGLSAVTGLLTSLAVCAGMRDKPSLSEGERQIRRAGRYGAVVGAALGVGVNASLVGVMGISGYSAVGISTGLAALGATVGGGMAAGVGTALVLVVVATVAMSCLAYHLTQRRLQQQVFLSPPAQPGLAG